jgi:hypothetical protein
LIEFLQQSSVLFSAADFVTLLNRVTRWVCEKIAQNGALPIFCQNQCINLRVDKSGPKFGLPLSFSKYMPKVSNRSTGENSPNLVTLRVFSTGSQLQLMDRKPRKPKNWFK